MKQQIQSTLKLQLYNNLYYFTNLFLAFEF